MWAYIIAAARGDSRHSIHKRNNSSANSSDDHLYTYRHGKVFTLSNTSGPIPGPSGLNSQSMAKNQGSSLNKKLLRANAHSPKRMLTGSRLEEGIEPFEEVLWSMITKDLTLQEKKKKLVEFKYPDSNDV
ncbi:unnamed protein product [Diatraea saccharalis]|uniref:Uncharacterized protein n=1 Tax=Diatraea saccharalis TaxID=40085 RepID=A0A9N9N213_9NEOP|nr:unnamed protein product [Diatraea saccharalis]